MKHSTDNILRSNLLQALQKNKVIQDRLTDCQHDHYVKLLRDMQTYNVKEKFNQDLLYTWKKENYIRQLKKDLQVYKEKHVETPNDPFYEYQCQKLDEVINGQQSLMIPRSEEERRVNVSMKYHRFLQKNPLQTVQIPAGQPARVSKGNIADDDEGDDEEVQEEANTRGLEETWKRIHAQSAHPTRSKSNTRFPHIRRSTTRNESRRVKSSAKTFASPRTPQKPTAPIIKNTDPFHSSSDGTHRRSPLRSSTNPLDSSDNDSFLMTSDVLDNHTHGDLIAMRSIRRPQRNPTEMNLLFETRKRIYHINKNSLDIQLNQRKLRLQPRLHFGEIQQTNPTNQVANVIENVQKENDQTQQKNDPVII